MLIREIHLKEAAEEKIQEHGVVEREAEEALLRDEPKYFKARNGRYMGIGVAQRFITVIFEYADGIATIVTAYPSSKSQIKLYHRK
ncbi:hypothetical protein HYU16_03390 [Candidatus Woesearchaeota archaeon]|nr:hypothetical protein [Candidatus Woesearchaeota archaeon]